METRCVNDQPVGRKGLQFVLVGTKEHVISEEIRPGIFRDHADPLAVFRRRAHMGIAYKNLPAVEVGPNLAEEFVEPQWIKRSIDIAPPDIFRTGAVPDDEPVARGATFEWACIDSYSPGGCDYSLPVRY